ncbi:hypothetical protein AcidC75_19470 [Acidisoma sp. C75]
MAREAKAEIDHEIGQGTLLLGEGGGELCLDCADRAHGLLHLRLLRETQPRRLPLGRRCPPRLGLSLDNCPQLGHSPLGTFLNQTLKFGRLQRDSPCFGALL